MMKRVVVAIASWQGRGARERGVPCRAVLCAAVLCAALVGSGCNSAPPPEHVSQAKQQLALGKPQEALDLLADDQSAEALYVKSIALFRKELKDAGSEQIQKALSLSPGDVRYRAYQLRMQLLAGNEQAADEILSIYDEHKSIASVALAAGFAYAVKQKPQEAMQTLKASIALSDEAPEFLPDMLVLALRSQMASEAQLILSKIEKLGPDDPWLARQRIATLLLLNEFDAAVRQARELYTKEDHTEPAARLYARALSNAAASAERDKAFEELLQRYPREDELIVMYANYLTKSKRLPQALDYLQQCIARLPSGSKDLLMNVAVSLALDAGDAELAESQLDKYRSEIRRPLLIALYEGRILLLRKEFDRAITKLAAVMEAGKDDRTGNLALATEAYKWLYQSQAEKQVSETLQKQADEATAAIKNSKADERKKQAKKTQDVPKAEPQDEPATIEEEGADKAGKL